MSVTSETFAVVCAAQRLNEKQYCARTQRRFIQLPAESALPVIVDHEHKGLNMCAAKVCVLKRSRRSNTANARFCCYVNSCLLSD